MSNHSTLIIGCGSIGERHLRCFRQTGRTEVTACDVNPALLTRMAGTYKVPVTDNWQQALASGRYDSVSICTPAPFHVSMAIAALGQKVHTLVEKPLSNTLEGVDRLLAAHAASGVQAAVAYVFHMFPALAQAREFLRGGELGPVRQVVFTSGQPFHKLRPAYAQTYYRDRRMGGGAIQDALTHAANWIESVVGPTDSLMCDCAHLALPDVEVEDTVHINARNAGTGAAGAAADAGPVLVNYSLSQFQAPNETTYLFSTALGSVKIESHNQRWGVMRMGEPAWTWHEARVTDRDAHFIAQANAFLDQVEGKPARLCTLAAAAQTLRFNLAALASAGAGKRIFCNELPAQP